MARAVVPRGDNGQDNAKWTANWKRELTIQLYPSSDLSQSAFTYDNGERNTPVLITMTMDVTSDIATIEYGAIDVSGRLVAFVNGVKMNATLNFLWRLGEFRRVGDSSRR